MPTIEETINTLKDMGFSEAQAKKALNKTGWSGIEAAAEWLLSNPGDDGTEEKANIQKGIKVKQRWDGVNDDDQDGNTASV